MPSGLNVPAGTVALEVAAELDKFERQMERDVPKALPLSAKARCWTWRRSRPPRASRSPRSRLP